MMRFGDKAPAKADPMADDETEGEPSMPSLSGMAGKKSAAQFRAAIDSGDDAALFKAAQALYRACEDTAEGE